MATKYDVIKIAFRRIGVVADDEPMTADQRETGAVLLDSIYAEVEGIAPPYWTAEDVPSQSFQPLARLLAVDIAPLYERPEPESRGVAMVRLLATIRPDDRAEIPAAEFY